jgi:phage replication initiation protein
MIIDWLSFSLPYKSNNFDFLYKNLGKPIIDMNKKGLQGYKQSQITETGAIIGFNPDKKENKIHVVMSGKVLAIQEFNINDFIRQIFELEGNFTRFDLAIDDFVGILDLEEIYKFLKNSWIVTKFRGFKRIQADEKHGIPVFDDETGEQYYIFYSRVDSLDFKSIHHGTTIYVGSRASSVFVRFYDKKAEQQNNDINHWVRCEFVFKKERANEVLKNYIYNKDFNMLGLLYYYIDFKDIGTNKLIYRCKTIDWWQKFLNVNVKEKITIKKQEASIEKMKDWIKHQVSGSLTFLYQLYGLDFIEEILELGNQKIEKNIKYRKLMSGVEK